MVNMLFLGVYVLACLFVIALSYRMSYIKLAMPGAKTFMMGPFLMSLSAAMLASFADEPAVRSAVTIIGLITVMLALANGLLVRAVLKQRPVLDRQQVILAVPVPVPVPVPTGRGLRAFSNN